MTVGVRRRTHAETERRTLESGTVILEMKDGSYEPIRECDVL